jgi:2'-5' RNA ligase
MPPHVTLLFPFVRAAAVNGRTLSDLGEHFSALTPFGAELTGVGRFDEHVWLAPEPRERFVDLITATLGRFPEFPPYEGKVGNPVPHLTIAAVGEGDDGTEDRTDAIAELAQSELAGLLPLRFAVQSVSLFEERGDGMWQESSRFELG